MHENVKKLPKTPLVFGSFLHHAPRKK